MYDKNESLYTISSAANTWPRHQLKHKCKYNRHEKGGKTSLNRMLLYSGLLIHCLITFLKLENYMW